MERAEGPVLRAVRSTRPAGGSPDRRLSASTDDSSRHCVPSRRPMTLASLAEMTSLHPNTVREHLDTLVRAGLPPGPAHNRRAAAGPRGSTRRPRSSRRASEYAALVVVLSSAITRISAHPSTDAELAGEEWGRDLARRRGAAPTTPESARDRAVELFDDFGFEPRPASRSPSLVRLTRCPLLEAARTNPTSCAASTWACCAACWTSTARTRQGSALVPFAEPGACRVVIPPVDDLS